MQKLSTFTNIIFPAMPMYNIHSLTRDRRKTFLAICLDCRPHLEHMDKGDGSLRIKGGEWTGSAKPDVPRGEKGALGSPITDDSGFPKTDSPITLWHGVFCSIECSAKRIDSAAFEYNSLVPSLFPSSHFSVEKYFGLCCIYYFII